MFCLNFQKYWLGITGLSPWRYFLPANNQAKYKIHLYSGKNPFRFQLPIETWKKAAKKKKQKTIKPCGSYKSVSAESIWKTLLLVLFNQNFFKNWCWERLKMGREGDDRGWDGWMASPTQCTWVWVNSGSWWWTGRPGMLQSMGLQRVRHDWATELNWIKTWNLSRILFLCVTLPAFFYH